MLQNRMLKNSVFLNNRQKSKQRLKKQISRGEEKRGKI